MLNRWPVVFGNDGGGAMAAPAKRIEISVGTAGREKPPHQAGFIDCILRTDGTVLDQAQFYLPTGGGGAAPSDEMAVLLAGVDLPAGGTLEFLCQRANAQVSGVSADDIRMTAIGVDSLTAISG